MNWFLILVVHLLRTVALLLRPSGSKTVIAQSLLLKHQLLILTRDRKRAPNASSMHRLLLGFWCCFLSPRRIHRGAIVFRPSSLLRFHDLLKKLKYRRLFSSATRSKPGPKGPDLEVIAAIVEFKRRNPRCGCPRIARQMSHAFGLDIDKDLVRGKRRRLKTDRLQAERENGKRRASVHDFHSFRVTWITLALAAGVPLELVQRVTPPDRRGRDEALFQAGAGGLPAGNP